MKLYEYGEKLLQVLRYRRIVQDIPYGSHVVDIGCGNGNILTRLEPRILRGIGLDRLAVLPPNTAYLEFYEWDAENTIPICAGEMDVAICLAVIEHLQDPEPVIKECLRVLKPTGCLILTSPTPRAKLLLEFLAYKLHLISEEQIRDHKHYYEGDDLEYLLRIYGFQGNITVRSFQCGMNTYIKAYKR
jgi:SAM-dependent methyltransferase